MVSRIQTFNLITSDAIVDDFQLRTALIAKSRDYMIKVLPIYQNEKRIEVLAEGKIEDIKKFRENIQKGVIKLPITGKYEIGRLKYHRGPKPDWDYYTKVSLVEGFGSWNPYLKKIDDNFKSLPTLLAKGIAEGLRQAGYGVAKKRK